MNADELDADDLPPCVGEGFRDALADMLRNSREIAGESQRQKPLKPKRGGQSQVLGLDRAKRNA